MNTKQIDKFIQDNCASMSDAELGAKVGLSKDQVRHRRLKLVGGKEKVVLDPEQQFQLDMEKLRLRREESVSDKKYRIAMGEILQLRGELETILSVKDQVNTYSIPLSKGTGGEAVAVVVASDWHVEENVDPETVNGTNEYTMAIAKKRAEKFFQHTLQLVEKEQQAVKINTLVLALLGDFFSGNIHEELMETCEVPPQDAMLFAQNLIASGIKFLLANSKLKIIVPCCVGNHSRMTKKVHMATEAGNSLEWAMYNFLAKYFEDEPRIEFVLTRSYHNYIDINGFVIRFHHGHSIKYGGGIGGLTTPVIKAIDKFNLARKADLDVFGHFHQKMDGGRFIINGSLIGDTPYGKRLGFTGRPEQVFFLIDKKRGKTVVCPVLVE